LLKKDADFCNLFEKIEENMLESSKSTKKISRRALPVILSDRRKLYNKTKFVRKCMLLTLSLEVIYYLCVIAVRSVMSN